MSFVLIFMDISNIFASDYINPKLMFGPVLITLSDIVLYKREFTNIDTTISYIII